MNTFIEKKDVDATSQSKATLQAGAGGTLIFGVTNGKKRESVYLSPNDAKELLKFLNHFYGAKS